MSTSALSSPVVVDGLLSDEKLAQLLALRAEYPELDYKSTIDLSSTRGRVELAKDAAAMQVRGGYIVAGVADDATPTGELDEVDTRPFDEARLVPILLRYLPEPLHLRTRVAEYQGHTLVLLYVGAHPGGCVFFQRDGQYARGTEQIGGCPVARRS